MKKVKKGNVYYWEEGSFEVLFIVDNEFVVCRGSDGRKPFIRTICRVLNDDKKWRDEIIRRQLKWDEM